VPPGARLRAAGPRADQGRASNSCGALLLAGQRRAPQRRVLLARAGGMARAHMHSMKIRTKIKAGPGSGCNEINCLKAA
jgi:hypothetical protein